MTHHPAYPAYKPSGVEWLGEIPSHWEVKRLRFACKLNPSKSELLNFPPDTQVSFLPMEKIGEDGSFMLDETRSLEQVWQGFTFFRDRDVAVAKITPCFENGKGAMFEGLVNGVGFGTTELHILRSSEVTDPKFIFYLTRSHPFRHQGVAMMYGAAGQQRVPGEFFENFITAFPPLPEQRAIAAYLDRETARLDAVIAESQHLITLFRERRAALIAYVVTQGLDPDAPRKDSGVEWLGEIPSHWEAKQLRHLAESLQTGPFGSQLHSSDYVTDGIPLVNPAHMKNGFIVPDWEVTADVPTCERLKHQKLQVGDIVFARRGELGRCALVTEKEEGWLCGTGSLRMRPDLNVVHPPFLNRVLSTAGVAEWFSLESVGTTMENLNTSILAKLPLPLPPLPEQRAIAAYLDRETARLDNAVAEAETLIAHLEEYRAALIAAAVTGKIDVRCSMPSWLNTGGLYACPDSRSRL